MSKSSFEPMLTVDIAAAEAKTVVGVAVALSPIDLFFHFEGKVGRRGRVLLVELCVRVFTDNFAACLPVQLRRQRRQISRTTVPARQTLLTDQTEITTSRAQRVACVS